MAAVIRPLRSIICACTYAEECPQGICSAEGASSLTAGRCRIPVSRTVSQFLNDAAEILYVLGSDQFSERQLQDMRRRAKLWSERHYQHANPGFFDD